VGGNLWLANTKITSLPEGLTVGGNLYLADTPITSLPKGLTVGGDLYLTNTPLAKQTDEKIKVMIGSNGYIKGKIYR